MNGAKSKWSSVASGIPQGSVLGPVGINDLSDSCDCSTLLFADDTKVFQEVKSTADCEKLQAELNHLQNEWNKLSADCVHSSSVNMFKNRIDNYLVRAGYT